MWKPGATCRGFDKDLQNSSIHLLPVSLIQFADCLQGRYVLTIFNPFKKYHYTRWTTRWSTMSLMV